MVDLGGYNPVLQVTHSQWIYQCILIHDRTTGTLISAHKAKLLIEIKHQLSLGSKGLDEEDQFLLECNFDELTSTTGKHQEYWLLAIKADQEASCLCAGAEDSQQQCSSVDTP
jgi:hypothetical protein